MTSLGNTRENIEAGEGLTSHLCGVLQSSDTGGDLVRSGDVDYINGHGKAVSGVPCVFLRQVTGKWGKRSLHGNCQQEGAERVLKETGNQDVRMYIESRQETVYHWVDLWTIFEVCA